MDRGKHVSIMKNIKNAFIHEKGFTLIEAMMSLMILSVIMFFLPLIVHSFTAVDRMVHISEDFEWNLFLVELRNEIKKADNIAILQDRLFIYKGELITMYEKHRDTIRKKVNNLGNETVLQNVQSLGFTIRDDSVVMSVEFTSKIKEEALFLMQQAREEE